MAQDIPQLNDLPSSGLVCATMEQDSINRRRFPERGTLQEFETLLQKKIREIERERAAGRTQVGIITIPIVFHIIHNGEAVGTGTNLSQAQITSQIAVVNEDFRRMAGTPGFNDNPSGADVELEFCLSKFDNNGKEMTEPGIHRVRGSQTSWSRNQIEGVLKPSTYWDPNQFYNVWTLDFSSEDDLLLGYAQFPDQSGLPGLNERGGPASTDGVVIRYNVCGSADKGDFPVLQAPHNKGRTLVHETGHWLGLRHIWGDGPCAEDFVSDTPDADGPNRGCPVGRVSCGGVNMVQNYMDYTDDACMNIFTKGQKTRMLAVMEISPRRNTLGRGNLCSTVIAGNPIADFTKDKSQCVLRGSEVNFTDLSINFPNEWSWTFEGGDPNTSSLKNPQVTYNSPGIFDVTLIVKNANGSDTLLLDNIINVSEEGICRDFNNFLPAYTPTVIRKAAFGNYKGYLTGHNSEKTTAFSEFFINTCGYKYASGVRINFGKVYSTDEKATVNVTVWNARGPQSAPGSVIETKKVLLKQIQDDVANNRATEIIFERETPVFSRPFHVGVEINYSAGDSIAIVSSANGEATTATSWVKLPSGEWRPFTIAYGANIAMDISPIVGINPSVQVAASTQMVTPGQEVILNARGASVFIWNADDGSVQNVPGPQIKVNPLQTTTYTISGSGLELCNNVATITIYANGAITGIEENIDKDIRLYPNPGNGVLNIQLQNSESKEAFVQLFNGVGQRIGLAMALQKAGKTFTGSVNTSEIPQGLYLLQIQAGGKMVIRKWLKLQ
ncbi:MAG: M43 family zinc metalloprotease [Cyclobacteriaceae bacterium]